MNDISAHLLIARCLRDIVELHGTAYASKYRHFGQVCSRGKVALTHCRELLNHLLHLGLEAQLKTLVKLIDDKHPYATRVDIPLGQMIIQTTGRTYNY